MKPENPQIKELSREELFELVWSKPMTTAATELGISDVALAKRCKKFSVPTPRRGYWARIEAGQTIIRPKLPPMIGGSEPQSPASAHHTRWPRDLLGLCDRAQAFLAELKKLKPNYENLQSLENPLYPRTSITMAMVEPAARLFHAILVAVEATGVPLRKARSKYDGAYFESKGDRLYLEIEEVLKPSAGSHAWGEKKQGTGRLSITLSTQRYGHGWKKAWEQGEDGGVREIVTSIARTTTDYYADLAKKRAEEAERWRLERERWRIEEEARKQRLHEQTLVDTARNRATDFLHAVEWAHLHNRALDFISECDRRWKKDSPVLTPEQEAWLRWARDAAEAWSPWLTGYPDPANDGSFDPGTVPFGGPYPVTRKFPRPPTMPEIKSESNDPWSASKKGSYPIWLR